MVYVEHLLTIPGTSITCYFDVYMMIMSRGRLPFLAVFVAVTSNWHSVWGVAGVFIRWTSLEILHDGRDGIHGDS